MSFVVVRTVPDRGAAEVAREALVAAGIEVELKQRPWDPYRGMVSADLIDVRVPSELGADAEAVLARLAEEVSAPLAAEWSESPPPPTENAGTFTPPAWVRDSALTLLVTILSPIPLGCLLVRLRRPAAILIAATFALLIVAATLPAKRALLLGYLLVRALDLALGAWAMSRRLAPDSPTENAHAADS